MHKYCQLILILILAGSTQAAAVPPDYTFISLGYSRFSLQLDGYSAVPKGNGMMLDLSFAVRPHASVIASYRAGSADEGRLDAEIKSTSLGLMVNLPINDTADFLVAVSFFNGYTDVELNKSGTRTVRLDADGGTSAIGFRAMVLDSTELNGFIYRKAIQGSSIIGIILGSAYYINESVSVNLSYLYDSDNDLLGLGVTKYF